MSSPVLNQDMIMEILSRLPTSEIGKTKILNKECNKRSHESWFLNLNRHRNNSISGYFVQRRDGRYELQTRFVYEQRDLGNNRVSIDFLPKGNVKIEACDASYGIVLCVDDTGPNVPEYIVCKPTTKQYQIIPNPKMHTLSIKFGLAVIQLNPFRYKILRLSRFTGMNRFRTFVCEVFDSDSFMWKRLKNLRLPKIDGLIFSEPVQAYGFLHWLSRNDNVIRFCLKTEIWSFLRVPKSTVSPELVDCEGKLGVFSWWIEHNEKIHRLWGLKSCFRKSWEMAKEIKRIGVIGNNVCFRFCSDYEKVDLKERRNVPRNAI